MLKDAVKYLLGSAGPSGFGSSSTADDVAAAAAAHLRSITAIITGNPPHLPPSDRLLLLLIGRSSPGATSGIGLETARALAAHGARLILPARSPTAVAEAKAKISGTGAAGEIIALSLDLGSLSSVRSFVSDFLALRLPLNLLINNAGRFSYGQAESEDGIELTFATNYLGEPRVPPFCISPSDFCQNSVD
ncbi:Short-chain dehydrogenase TIC 32, chloroplastic [Apostasia shenzhenica]|uniref:Short-chain dehydrogenase TIC 32, chloroplastic n=1 Tax=Apostasia shenzhenica TaxID=1088818 RepID=A0A2I0BF24_9ASPA|nr:Short-chain dehydrogenase TIC 32, chloroplastic [Apostasia shenzhenica]